MHEFVTLPHLLLNWLVGGVLSPGKIYLKVISGRVPTSHWWWLHSTEPLGNQVSGIITQYHTQLHYPDTDLTSPCPILQMPSARLRRDEYPFKKTIGLTHPEIKLPTSLGWKWSLAKNAEVKSRLLHWPDELLPRLKISTNNEAEFPSQCGYYPISLAPSENCGIFLEVRFHTQLRYTNASLQPGVQYMLMLLLQAV